MPQPQQTRRNLLVRVLGSCETMANSSPTLHPTNKAIQYFYCHQLDRCHQLSRLSIALHCRS
ncbi:hypothetical protein BJV77DRAFT_1035876 [Russula vinacea]|nr:hypothetical protein BJV77DRAFT_1035876 [Russula vinacea]